MHEATGGQTLSLSLSLSPPETAADRRPSTQRQHATVFPGEETSQQQEDQLWKTQVTDQG